MAIGPVEILVVSFPGNEFSGEIAPALAELVETGLIRVIDLVFIAKDAEGDVVAIELNELVIGIRLSGISPKDTRSYANFCPQCRQRGPQGRMTFARDFVNAWRCSHTRLRTNWLHRLGWRPSFPTCFARRWPERRRSRVGLRLVETRSPFRSVAGRTPTRTGHASIMISPNSMLTWNASVRWRSQPPACIGGRRAAKWIRRLSSTGLFRGASFEPPDPR